MSSPEKPTDSSVGQVTLTSGRSEATLTPRDGRFLLVIEETPHPGSLAFMRQLARRPYLLTPSPEEVERRMVEDAAQLRAALRRHAFTLTREQEERLARFLED